jgi:Fe-S cluster biogenesis protein NfuA/nitrite reductase/ring-hydroxylating ferredoxin subunit
VDDQAARERIARVETLLDEVESLPDAAGRATATELVQALVELYGEGLARIMERVNGAGDGLLEDELVTHLLLLHDLHPVPLEQRVLGALEEVRPYMESHKGGVELVSIDEGVVRLRLQGSCSGCPSSTMTLKLAIEDAIHKAAPDVEEIVADGVVEERPAPILQIQVAGQPRLDNGDGWATAGSLAELSSGGAVVKRVEGEDVLFARVGDSSYAYRRSCPGCGTSLDGDSLHGTEFRCGACGNRYDAIRAGRCLEQPRLQLEPVPLLATDAGLVKIALRPAAA